MTGAVLAQNRHSGQRPAPTDGVVLRGDDGQLLPFEPSRWHGQATLGERRLLARLSGPVLDVGCGPGRIVEGLTRLGVPALGVDTAPGAVALTRRRGCAVVQRSVFAPLPGEGGWASVLLIDGNVGIGGDPVRLLRRCRSLMCSTGVVVAEVEAPGCGWRTCRARLERADEMGPWFEWSVVGADAIDGLAQSAGLVLRGIERVAHERWFACLTAEVAPAQACA